MDHKTHQRAMFIHRRDLRLTDVSALTRACAESEEVLSCFIYDPRQLSESNEYRNLRQISFMHESLEELAQSYAEQGGKLHRFYGPAPEVLGELIRTYQPEAVYVNEDYTPFSKKRDAELKALCSGAGVAWISEHDILLSGDPDTLSTGAGKSYTVFTPYWKKAREVQVEKPTGEAPGPFFTGEIESMKAYSITTLPDFVTTRWKSAISPGREAARALLQQLGEQSRYAETHDFPTQNTSHLSAHIKFGTLSIREVYHTAVETLGEDSGLVRQLYWHDFYIYIVHHFPHVIGNSYESKHNMLFWGTSEEDFKKWMDGMTGFPIVDAGMRELKETGYMHNRVRLIVGSFLTKDLHLPWWWGEKYFAQELVDYDVCVNNGNWQWVGGTGVDPVPYFRIFNPWLQTKRFDPDAVYIKKWVPELREYSAAEIHTRANLTVAADSQASLLGSASDYPTPMVDHATEVTKIKALYIK